MERRRRGAWEPLRPELVVEVVEDQVTAGRSPARQPVLRVRPDEDADQCTMDQLGYGLRPAELDGLLLARVGRLVRGVTGP